MPQGEGVCRGMGNVIVFVRQLLPWRERGWVGISPKGGGGPGGCDGWGPTGVPPPPTPGDTFWDHFGVVFGTFGSFWAFLRSVFLGSFWGRFDVFWVLWWFLALLGLNKGEVHFLAKNRRKKPEKFEKKSRFFFPFNFFDSQFDPQSIHRNGCNISAVWIKDKTKLFASFFFEVTHSSCIVALKRNILLALTSSDSSDVTMETRSHLAFAWNGFCYIGSSRQRQKLLQKQPNWSNTQMQRWKVKGRWVPKKNPLSHTQQM